MENEYIVINKTELLKEIESLKYSLSISEKSGDTTRAAIENFEIKRLEHVLSQSTPFIPEIKKAWEDGRDGKRIFANFPFVYKKYINKTSQDYISNLKLDI